MSNVNFQRTCEKIDSLLWSCFDACITILILDPVQKLAHSFSLCVIAPSLCSFPAGPDDDKKRLQGFYISSIAETVRGLCQPRQPAHNAATRVESVVPPQQEQISFLHISLFLQYTAAEQHDDSLTDYQLIQTSVGSFHFPQQWDYKALFWACAVVLYSL